MKEELTRDLLGWKKISQDHSFMINREFYMIFDFCVFDSSELLNLCFSTLEFTWLDLLEQPTLFLFRDRKAFLLNLIIPYSRSYNNTKQNEERRKSLLQEPQSLETEIEDS